MPQTPGGRYLNRSPDPVMNVEEIIAVFEEYDIVPHILSRTDVILAFRAATAVPGPEQPHRLMTAQVVPDEVRYCQFCDLLIRLAVAAFACVKEGVPEVPTPEQCVQQLMDLMDLSNPNIIPLKQRLDAMARVANDRGAKKKLLKWKYISPKVAYRH